jgi:predicted small lipoprotein YifL
VFEKQTVAKKIVLWCFCLSLSACGYRGALFLPKDVPVNQQEQIEPEPNPESSSDSNDGK